MENRIKKVLADVLMVDISLITDDTSPDTLEKWDSMNQMNIIVALEEEFEIQISDDDVIEMLNVKLIQEILKSYIK
ncbi:acyl carrier protein [Aliarcobacter butzleri]|uniref:acyl carrier protein n=1 Tax=Aliarcobacter butzleri TaxID=28197 RepID=UPI001260E860|nr:acyl carrier protein [Aliarcobacter butzleri]